MKALMMVMVAAATCTACAGGSTTGTSGSSSNSSGAAVMCPSAGANPMCSAVNEGRWSMGTTSPNDCFGMDMTMKLDFEQSTCCLTFSQPSMTMDRPDGATVNGNAVTFFGGQGGSWSECTGTLNGGNRIEGSCGGGQPCTFTMTIP